MVDLNVGESERDESNSGDSWDSEENETHEDNINISEILEPHLGMEFDSEDNARRFYYDYARRIGFVVRIMQSRRSEIDGKTLARRLGCNKQGFSTSIKGKIGPEKKPRPSGREGCKANVLFKLEKSGKWVVTRLVKEHNHPLVVNGNELSNMRDKDNKIQELVRELQHQEELCAAYREKLVDLLAHIETRADHLSEKVLAVIENVKKAEAEALNEALKLPAATPA
ncbi:Far-red impaired responsive (FAR1) family protein [Striga asiatica]|uniref:Far-red impaired responsive (FAR1) family protein n=1 Tax=Striga asiatica TaxID=4170 RepID=A0A5A7RDV3_STRAF|nr:Far-red impaired responsive (FAR1) family protein [Striga asiatica]